MQSLSRFGAALALVLAALSPVYAAPTTSEPLKFDLSAARQGYRLRSGDQIRVDVVGFEELSREQTVLPDGTINVLYVGTVRAAGRTPEELTEQLRREFDGILKKPAISVSVLETRPLQVNVIGEVVRPGPQQFVPGAPGLGGGTGGGMTSVRARLGVERVSGALALAGGVTPTADIRKVTIVREQPDGSTARLEVDLWKALRDGDFKQDLNLVDGDTVIVAKLTEQLDEEVAQQIAASKFAPATIALQVGGEVQRPGPVEIDPRSNLMNAVYQAGGPTREGDISKVVVARLSPNGRVERIPINLNEVADGRSRFQVRTGDVIYVPRADSFQFADQSRAFLSPFTALFQTLFFPFRIFGL